MIDTIDAEYVPFYGLNRNRVKSVNPMVRQSSITQGNETTAVSGYLSE